MMEEYVVPDPEGPEETLITAQRGDDRCDRVIIKMPEKYAKYGITLDRQQAIRMAHFILDCAIHNRDGSIEGE